MSKYGTRYDWKKVAEYYYAGNTYLQTKEHFGFAAKSWNDAVKRGDIIPRKSSGNIDLIPIEKLKARSGIKKRLLDSGVLPYACSICGLDKWQGETLPLHLDHIDGNKYNNSADNLRLLCPNCHALEPTSNGKNKGRYTKIVKFPLELG